MIMVRKYCLLSLVVLSFVAVYSATGQAETIEQPVAKKPKLWKGSLALPIPTVPKAAALAAEGDLLVKEGAYPEAVAKYREAISTCPYLASMMQIKLISVLKTMGDYKGALKAFQDGFEPKEKFASAFTKEPRLLVEMGEVALLAGDQQAAERAFLQVTSIEKEKRRFPDPRPKPGEDPRPYAYLIAAYENLCGAQDDKARAGYEMALSLKPGWEVPRLYLAFMDSRKQRPHAFDGLKSLADASDPEVRVAAREVLGLQRPRLPEEVNEKWRRPKWDPNDPNQQPPDDIMPPIDNGG
jgi:tetratricopeptide (TPR) repeat protein